MKTHRSRLSPVTTAVWTFSPFSWDPSRRALLGHAIRLITGFNSKLTFRIGDFSVSIRLKYIFELRIKMETKKLIRFEFQKRLQETYIVTKNVPLLNSVGSTVWFAISPGTSSPFHNRIWTLFVNTLNMVFYIVLRLYISKRGVIRKKPQINWKTIFFSLVDTKNNYDILPL